MIELHANRIGSHQAPRWIVKSSKELFWTGCGWSPYYTDALLFYELSDAQNVISELMQALLDAMNTWTYRTIVEFEVKGFDKPSLWSLKKHLREHHNVSIDSTVEGPKSSLIFPNVNWATLREIK